MIGTTNPLANHAAEATGPLTPSRRRRSSHRVLMCVAVGAMALPLIAADARAEDFNWSGGGTSANWTNIFNWEGLKTPSSTGDAIVEFPGNAARGRSVVNESYTINRLEFTYGSLSVGRSFTLDVENDAGLSINAGIRNATELTQTINVPIVLGGGGTHNVGNDNAGTLTFSRLVTLSGGGRITSQSGSGGRVVFAGPLGGSGTLEVGGTGTVQLAAANLFSGTLDIRGGTLEFATGNQLGALTNTITFNQALGSPVPTLRRTSSGTTVLPINVVSSLVEGRLFADADWTHSAAISGNGGIAKDGGGTLTLTDALTYKGRTRVLAGELIITGDARVPDNRLELSVGARLSYASGISDTIGSLAGDGGTVALASGSVLTVGSPAATMPQTNGTGTFAGEILGAASLVHAGTGSLVLRGPSFYTGGTTISGGGALVADDTSGGSATGSGAVEVKAGSQLAGDGAVGGTVTLRSGAVIAPSNGSTPGTGTGSLVVGKLIAEPSASVRIELNGATAGFTIDQLNVVGDATLTGATLDLRSLSNFNPALTLQPTAIVTIANQRSGIFARVEGVAVTPTASLAVTYDGQAVRVRTARPGDATLDAQVNFTDLVRLAQNYNGVGKEWSLGDFNGDGTVSFPDLVVLAMHYNTSGSAGASAALEASLGASFASDWALAQSLVPEPTALAGFVLGVALAARRRKI